MITASAAAYSRMKRAAQRQQAAIVRKRIAWVDVEALLAPLANEAV